MKINGQTPPGKEVEAKQTIDAGTWWQSVTKHWKPCTFLAQSNDPVECDAWCKLNTASCGHLNAVRHQCRVVADSNQHTDVYYRACRPGVNGESEHGAAGWPP